MQKTCLGVVFVFDYNNGIRNYNVRIGLLRSTLSCAVYSLLVIFSFLTASSLNDIKRHCYYISIESNN